MTAAFAFLWLVSSSAWGKGLTDVKWATNPERLVESCKEVCLPGESPSMGRLNASVVSCAADPITYILRVAVELLILKNKIFKH